MGTETYRSIKMPAFENGTIKWIKEDFTRHGYLATYAVGECRCDICVKHWEEWVEDAFGGGEVPTYSNGRT
jgi:hypothetical protein